jgi:hypothetical protein
VSEVRQPTKPLDTCASRCNIVPSGATSCETTTTTFVVWPPPLPEERGPRRFDRKLDSEDNGERPRGGQKQSATCAWRRLVALYGVTRPGAWSSCGLPFVSGHQRGLVRTLRDSGYSKNTGASTRACFLYVCHLAFAFTPIT